MGKAPDFDSKLYSAKLSENLSSMRGRELLGFTSARLMMGTVLADLEGLSGEVFVLFLTSHFASWRVFSSEVIRTFSNYDFIHANHWLILSCKRKICETAQ